MRIDKICPYKLNIIDALLKFKIVKKSYKNYLKSLAKSAVTIVVMRKVKLTLNFCAGTYFCN